MNYNNKNEIIKIKYLYRLLWRFVKIAMTICTDCYDNFSQIAMTMICTDCYDNLYTLLWRWFVQIAMMFDELYRLLWCLMNCTDCYDNCTHCYDWFVQIAMTDLYRLLWLICTDCYDNLYRLLWLICTDCYDWFVQIAMTLAVSGHSILYGRVDPYLKALELHEHCYIKGPDRCETEGVSIYTQIGEFIIRLFTDARCCIWIMPSSMVVWNGQFWFPSSHSIGKISLIRHFAHVYVSL